MNYNIRISYRNIVTDFMYRDCQYQRGATQAWMHVNYMSIELAHQENPT